MLPTAYKMLTILGKLVNCSTLVTETAAFSKALAVPPVETIVYLNAKNFVIIETNSHNYIPFVK